MRAGRKKKEKRTKKNNKQQSVIRAQAPIFFKFYLYMYVMGGCVWPGNAVVLVSRVSASPSPMARGPHEQGPASEKRAEAGREAGGGNGQGSSRQSLSPAENCRGQ